MSRKTVPRVPSAGLGRPGGWGDQKGSPLPNLCKKQRPMGRKTRNDAGAELTFSGETSGLERKNKRRNDFTPAQGAKGNRVCFHKRVCFVFFFLFFFGLGKRVEKAKVGPFNRGGES